MAIDISRDLQFLVITIHHFPRSARAHIPQSHVDVRDELI